MNLAPLEAGTAIALVAPASPQDETGLRQVSQHLLDLGFELRPGRYLNCRNGYLAGTDAERAEDLLAAIRDPEIRAVICVRGGYGSGRLLPWLPLPSLRDCAKPFLGFSDATFLHQALITQAGWTTFHGPNLITMAAHPQQLQQSLEALSGQDPFAWHLDPGQVLKSGIAEGPVLGGNLTCLCHLLGTPYFPRLSGALLLLEDRGEALYRLDRAITQLKLSGALNRLGALILGQFSDCGELQPIHDMILDHIKDLTFPVVADLPFGHTARNQVVPLNTPFRLNTHDHILSALHSPFRV
jgi:muramoyltetrapeptide carboxypeptidase